jgi:dTDP-4-amino-4,6-dideoxygalactose transaminase
MQVPFARPSVTEADIERVKDVMLSGWLSTGPEVAKFEARFSEIHGGLPCISVNSATEAMAIGLEIYDIGPGDEVLCSTWSFSSPTMEVYRRGATPVFVDVDQHTLNISLDDLKKKINPKTKAILVTHFAGYPVDMEQIYALVKGKGILVIEDCAHSPITVLNDKMAGVDPRTTFAIWSLYATKTLGAGEGGVLGCWDRAALDRAKKIRLHGFSKDAFDRYRSVSASWYYDVVCAGRKGNMTDLVAAIALGQIDRMLPMQARREEIAAFYNANLPHEITRPARILSSGIQSWHLYVVRVPEERDEFIDLLKEVGVQCSVHFRPIHMHTFWKPFYKYDCPIATREYDRVVSLPIYPTMTDDQMDYVVRMTRRACVMLYA